MRDNLFILTLIVRLRRSVTQRSGADAVAVDWPPMNVTVRSCIVR